MSAPSPEPHSTKPSNQNACQGSSFSSHPSPASSPTSCTCPSKASHQCFPTQPMPRSPTPAFPAGTLSSPRVSSCSSSSPPPSAHATPPSLFPQTRTPPFLRPRLRLDPSSAWRPNPAERLPNTLSNFRNIPANRCTVVRIGLFFHHGTSVLEVYIHRMDALMPCPAVWPWCERISN